MADRTDIDDDEADDFAESLAITHHLAILDILAILDGLEGAPKDELGRIRDALTSVLPPEDIVLMQDE